MHTLIHRFGKRDLFRGVWYHSHHTQIFSTLPPSSTITLTTFPQQIHSVIQISMRPSPRFSVLQKASLWIAVWAQKCDQIQENIQKMQFTNKCDKYLQLQKQSANGTWSCLKKFELTTMLSIVFLGDEPAHRLFETTCNRCSHQFSRVRCNSWYEKEHWCLEYKDPMSMDMPCSTAFDLGVHWIVIQCHLFSEDECISCILECEFSQRWNNKPM